MSKERSKHLKLQKYDKDLFDYDYWSKLSKEEQQYLINFHDEFYNARYVDKDQSVFNSEHKLNLLKDNEFEYLFFLDCLDQENENRVDTLKELLSDSDKFTKLHNSLNSLRAKSNLRPLNNIEFTAKIKKDNAKLTEMQFLVLQQQREASRFKQHRRNDTFNSAINMTTENGSFSRYDTKQVIDYKSTKNKKVSENNTSKIQSNAIYEVDEIPVEKTDEEDERKKLLLYIKHNKVPLFVAEKFIEMIDSVEGHTQIKQDLINKIRLNIEDYNKNKKDMSNAIFSKYLLSVFTGFKMLFKEDKQGIKIIENIFDSIIFPKYLKDYKKFN